MKYKNAIVSLGVLIAIILSPFIGISRSWKEGIAILLGLLISTLTYISTRTKRVTPAPVVHTEPSVSETVVSSSDVSSNPE